jgi:phycocyanobilin:ferredoxin oxidoreductase
MLEISQPSLRDQQHHLIRDLADRMEAVWHRYLDLEPYHLPAELGYVEGRLEGEKLIIENRCYQTPQFRKIHLELAKVGPLLDILHCVMFPRPNYALPMFGTDIVAGKGQVSAAIADLSPLNPDRTLSETYRTQLEILPIDQFSCPRQIPEWGDIFSEFCLFVRPESLEEETRFLDIVESYVEIHCQQAVACRTSLCRRSIENSRRSNLLLHPAAAKRQNPPRTRKSFRSRLGRTLHDRGAF